MEMNFKTNEFKHKKALSSLISSQTTHNNIFEFKTLHSPSISQITNSSISPNASKIDNFVTNFQNLHKSFVKPLLTLKHDIKPKPKFVSPLRTPKENSQEARTEYKNWITSNQLETSTILVPDNLALDSSKASVFHPFAINQQNDVDAPFQISGPLSGRSFLDRHLSFNDHQVKHIHELFSNLELEKYSKLFSYVSKKKKVTLEAMRRTIKLKRESNNKNYHRSSEIDFIESEDLDDFSDGSSLTYKFFVNGLQNSDAINRPSIREASSITVINFKAYLFGGLSNQLISTVHELDPNTWKWQRIFWKSDIEFTGRFGHTSLGFKNGFVVYGGEKQYNQALRVRECLSDVRYFNIETAEWRFVKTWGDFIEGRRNHAGVMLTRSMLIYGGINNNGRFLNDVVQLNIETQKWTVCEVETNNTSDEGIAFHSMCAIFKLEPKISSIYHPYEYQQAIKKGSNSNSTQRHLLEEGIYVFGGKNKANEANNRLKILKIGKKPLVWMTPITAGTPPSPRYQHSMTFQEEFNFLVIYGGRNDICGILGDMFLLRLSNLNWYNIVVHGDFVGRRRFGHVAASLRDKFLVFGGVDENGFSKGDLLLFELTPTIVRKLINEEIIRKRKSMLRMANEKLLETKESIPEEITKNQKPKKDEKQILLDSLNFKKFRSYMPLPKEEPFKEKNKTTNFWKKTLGGVKFLVKIQQSKLKSQKVGEEEKK